MKAAFNLSDSRDFSINIPETGAVGVFLSGGVDSSLLLYLISKTVKESKLDTRVHPITAERLGRPFNLRHAQRAKEFVETATGLQMGLHFCYTIPNHQEPYGTNQEQNITTHYSEVFSKRFKMSHVYFAHTQPLMEFKTDNHEFPSAAYSKTTVDRPFLKLNKHDIAELYQHEKLITTLFPKTRSCESGLHESDYFRKTCQDIESRTNCYGCNERDVAFKRYL